MTTISQERQTSPNSPLVHPVLECGSHFSRSRGSFGTGNATPMVGLGYRTYHPCFVGFSFLGIPWGLPID